MPRVRIFRADWFDTDDDQHQGWQIEFAWLGFIVLLAGYGRSSGRRR